VEVVHFDLEVGRGRGGNVRAVSVSPSELVK